MVEPRRAPVEPRVLRPGGTYALPLAEEIRALLDKGARGAVRVSGPPGSGKTTALQHLAAILPAGESVTYVDDGNKDLPALIRDYLIDHLVVYTTSSPTPDPADIMTLTLAAWARDDLLEYLLAAHPGQCGAVMGRLPVRGKLPLDGLPDVWRIILDTMVGDPAVADAHAALSCYVEKHFLDSSLVNRARYACLNVLREKTRPEQAMHKLARAGFDRELTRLLRYRPVQVLLATERMVSELRGVSNCDFLREALPVELIQSAGAKLAGDAAALKHLKKFLDGPTRTHPMAASLLLAADKSWAPARGSVRQLAGALLPGAQWPDAELSEAALADADFSHANLRSAQLDLAQAAKANFAHAQLHGASLFKLQAHGASFAHADLSRVRAENARFVGADLERADMSEAFLRDSSFREAKLSGADFRGADLSNAIFLDATIAGADFTGAILMEAILDRVRLRDACFTAAQLRRAYLRGCDMEDMNLDQTDFRRANLAGALLTGSSATGGNFTEAILCETGLAEVEWQGVCLRGADLRGATFHMGSTRSGLVGSPIACEGSRTGFYTDDYDEQHFKAPEEIRKANLRSADLREARIDNVDFYLVDLRDALYDPQQEQHLRRCGAILETRV
jgi:uncharacterized protein YjbI with pentapeptide repeats